MSVLVNLVGYSFHLIVFPDSFGAVSNLQGVWLDGIWFLQFDGFGWDPGCVVGVGTDRSCICLGVLGVVCWWGRVVRCIDHVVGDLEYSD